MPKHANARTNFDRAEFIYGDRLDLIEEATVDCPYCGEMITLVLDLSVSEQDYIEDCFICCQPIRVRYSADGGLLIKISVDSADA